MADPMYRQISEDLRRKIESGDLASGSQLPTELELREGYDASRNTVRDTIKWLTNLGLVATRPGQGTFVVQKIDPFVTTLSGNPGARFGDGEGASYLSEVSNRNRTPTTSRIPVEIQEAAPDIAEELGKSGRFARFRGRCAGSPPRLHVRPSRLAGAPCTRRMTMITAAAEYVRGFRSSSADVGWTAGPADVASKASGWGSVYGAGRSYALLIRSGKHSGLPPGPSPPPD